MFAQLPKAAQEQFLEASFDPVKGNGYTAFVNPDGKIAVTIPL